MVDNKCFINRLSFDLWVIRTSSSPVGIIFLLFFFWGGVTVCVSVCIYVLSLTVFLLGKNSLLFIILVLCIWLQCLELGSRWVKKHLFSVSMFWSFHMLFFYYSINPPLHWKWIYCLWQDIKMTLVFKTLLECQQQ